MAKSQNREAKTRHLRVFDAIASGEDLENAVHNFDAVLHEGNHISLLEQFLERPFLIEIVIEASNYSPLLRRWILEGASSFQRPDGFVSSFYWRLLSRVSNFLQIEQVPLPDNEGNDEVIVRYTRMVNSLPDVLESLSSSSLGTNGMHDTHDEKIEKKKWNNTSSKKKRPHQKSISHSGAVSIISGKTIDPAILKDFQISNISGKEEAIFDVLRTVKSILEFYLDMLCRPVVASAIRTTYLNQVGPSAYPLVQPLKSARHFSSAEGFGEWRILISTRADGNLREASRKDRKSFKIIVKKIKELSNGHFSDDNHKRLSGSSTEVPIFEAKMTRDSRIVYQIDVISDYGYKDEHQVIRIFGIYTHAQMDHRLWKSISLQLGRKGKEYIRRCEIRRPSAAGGNSCFSPASFPALDEDGLSLDQNNFFLPPDDLEQVHSLLVLEKYLTFSRELLHTMLANLDASFPFQVSPQERDIIEFPYSCFVLGRSGTGKTTTMLFKMLWREREYQLNSNTDITKPRQIFVTKSRVLAARVEDYFRKLFESLKVASFSPQELKEASTRQNVRLDETLRDLDEDEWRADLPEKFSDLQDSHFPLFITFERLCDLLEAEFEQSSAENVRYKKSRRSARVSFEVFLHEYWPHFSQTLAKNLDPALVYSEILGVIKGSEEATTTTSGYLDRQKYESLSERQHSTFASQRGTIYNIFECYRRQKLERNERDMADRTHAILRMLGENSEQRRNIVKKKVDQLCVDEVQDNLLSDALILRSLCHNPDGLFWAGDTAQTISVGSSFRFDDLKSFLFRVEETRIQMQNGTFQAHHAPKTFQLATNYRSHAGIVNCAHSIIELITRFWPYSIDNLAPERGIVEGLKPVFLHGWDDDSVRYEQFLFGSSGTDVELGAQQCILVRNEVARDKLQQQVGDIGVIMTLYESKGLEFDDVLLYNFFEDSLVEYTQWRLIFSAVDVDDGEAILSPQFNATRHAVLCNELKFLYVAVTRARKNLWIADQSEKAEPMRMFWSSRSQIQCCSPGMDVPKLAVAESSQKDWATKGKELFDRKRYLQARHCFERASMPREVAISNAYLLRDQARKHPPGDGRQVKTQRHEAFLVAAKSFLSCADDTISKVYFRRAAECLEAAEKDLEAARTYIKAEDYDIAASLFRKLGRFDNAIDVIKSNKDKMDPELVESITEVARLFYFREKQLKKARQLFSSDDDVLGYLEDLDLDVARAEVLRSLQRHTEAAELHLREGRAMVAIPLFLEDDQNKSSMRRAASAILQEFWTHIYFAKDTPANSQPVLDLLKWTTRLRQEDLEACNKNELRMFRTIMSDNRRELASLARVFLATKNLAAAVLCLNHHFKSFQDMSKMSIQELASYLELFLAYVDELWLFAFRTDPSTSSSASRLFGFRRVSSDEFFLPTDSFLYRQRSNYRQDNKVLGSELLHILQSAICSYLRACVTEERNLYVKVPQIMYPCISFSVHGQCKREDRHREHPPLSIDWYNLRIRILLQQILIIQKSQAIKAEDNWNERRYWIIRFYETLHPPFHLLGNDTHLDADHIPEFQRGIQVVKDWVQQVAYTLDFQNPLLFLTRLIGSAILGFTLDKSGAPRYWRSARLFQFQPPPPFLRPPNNDCTLPELLMSLEDRYSFSINSGLLSLSHFLNRRFSINISLLCDWIELLCSSAIFAHAARYRHGFHGITGPWSWVLRHTSSDVNELAMKHFNGILLQKLSGDLKELLEIIFTGVGAGHLLFENGNLCDLRFGAARSLFITRICKALSLLGYNIRRDELQHTILGIISSLNRPDRLFNHLYRRFVTASKWIDLVYALRDANRRQQTILSDELIQLHDLRRAGKPTHDYGIRFLTFRDENDLQCLLRNRTFADVERVPPSDDADNPELESAKGRTVSVTDTEDDLPGDDFDSETATDEAIIPSAEEFQDGDAHQPSELEHDSASRIQRAYKDFSRRRQKVTVSRRHAARQRFFVECLEQAQKLNWECNPSYRFVYLGPLPHLLVCLEVAHATITEQKKRAKNHLISASHQQLEDVGGELTKLNKKLKELGRVKATVCPTANLHQQCNVKELRTAVTEAVDVLQSLPGTAPDHFSPDLSIVIRCILTPSSKTVPKPKPELVLDDGYEYEMYTV